MSRLLDDFILRYSESQMFDFLTLHEFVQSVSNQIYLEKKYGDYLFFMAHGRPILYINWDKKSSVFYLSFTDGKKLKDKNGILQSESTKVVDKWFYSNREKLIQDEEDLKDLINQAIDFNRIKHIKH